MNAIMNIGELNYYISQLALISRQFDINYRNGMGDIYTIDRFLSIINSTKVQQANLLADYNSWSYCKSSDAIKDDVIPYVTFENPSKMMYTNLYLFIGEIIKNVIYM